MLGKRYVVRLSNKNDSTKIRIGFALIENKLFPKFTIHQYYTTFYFTEKELKSFQDLTEGL